MSQQQVLKLTLAATISAGTISLTGGSTLTFSATVIVLVQIAPPIVAH